jgi:hypothetical protein
MRKHLKTRKCEQIHDWPRWRAIWTTSAVWQCPRRSARSTCPTRFPWIIRGKPSSANGKKMMIRGEPSSARQAAQAQAVSAKPPAFHCRSRRVMLHASC